MISGYGDIGAKPTKDGDGEINGPIVTELMIENEILGNAIDDNKNGLIDENMAHVPFGDQSGVTFADRIDNDGNGEADSPTITQEMVDRLKPGMTRNQVEFVMGKPVLGDPFNDDQWVYIYTLEVPDYFNQVFKMVLAFEDDTLATISGDYIPQEADSESDAAADEGANETSDENEAESAG